MFSNFSSATHRTATLTSPLERTFSYTYISRELPASITRPSGEEVAMDYWPDGQLKSLTDGEGIIAFEYDSKGLLHKVIANNTDTTEYLYDAFGNVSTLIRPDLSTVSTPHDTRGDLESSSIASAGDPNTHNLVFDFDLNRRLLSTKDALLFSMANQFDARGRLQNQTDRHGNTTHFTWSPWGRSETITTPAQGMVTRQNDPDGLLEYSTDPLNNTSHTTWDGVERLATASNPLNHTTGYTYDANGNPFTFTNARNKTWTWEHSPTNRISTLTTPLEREFRYTYNERELLETVTTPSDETTTLIYYDDGRLHTATDTLGTITYTYDTKGRLHTITEGTDVITRDWDSLDRLETFTDANNNQIGYRYDGAGNLTRLIYPDAKEVLQVYDNAGRLETVTDWADRVTSYQYDNKSRLWRVNLPNDTRREFGYDYAGRLNLIRDTVISTGAVIHQASLTHDLMDRIKKEIITPEPAPFAVEPAIMTYDDDDRLISWNGQTTVSDLDGNLTTGPIDGALTTLVYDIRNRLESAGGVAYTYDAENRRVSLTQNGVTTDYVQDPQGALSRLLVSTTGSSTTRFVYAGDRLLYQENPNGEISVFHFDYRGSTTAITDDSGTVTDRMTYGAYGEIAHRTGTTTTPFLYHGAWGIHSDPNGLYHMRARYYSPEIRRFLNADPIGFDGGANWHAFVGGNPITRLDPLGLWYLLNPATWGRGEYSGISGGWEFWSETSYLSNNVIEAAGWINANYPELGNATDYLIEVNIPMRAEVLGDASMPGMLRLNLKSIEDQAELVSILAHELMHKREQWFFERFFDDLFFDGAWHDNIHMRSEIIKKEFYQSQKSSNY